MWFLFRKMVAMALAEPAVRHARNLHPRSECWVVVGGGGWGEQLRVEQRALVKLARAPVPSERLLCRAQQVSAEQLSPSLQRNTL